MERARTEREWRCQLILRSRRWVRLVQEHGKKADLADLGPIPLPPVSMVEYYTDTRYRRK